MTSDYREGLKDGIKRYAWMKDGTYYVGDGHHTLKKAIEIVLKDDAANRVWESESIKYPKYLKCINNEGYETSLKPNCLYQQIIPLDTRETPEMSMVAVFIENREAYLFPQDLFCEPTHKDFLEDMVKISQELGMYDDDGFDYMVEDHR